MTFTDYLKRQLTDIIDCYKKYFWKTSGTALTFTVLCFVAVGLILRFSNFDPLNPRRLVSILSCFSARYSIKDTYCLVDLSHTIFVFFVAFFSIGLTRLSGDEANTNEISFDLFFKKIKGKDILILLGILFVCSGCDFGLFKLGSLYSDISFHDFTKWMNSILFFTRIYTPLLFFSVTLYKLNSTRPLKLNFKKVLFLWMSLWLFNEFAYAVSSFVRAHVFGLLLLPFDMNKYYMGESILGVLLIAFYFIGYHSTMTTSLKLQDE